MTKWHIPLILAILITLHFFIWLRPGLLLGGGEAGLMFYQPDTVKTVNQFAWANKALGNPTGIVATAYPTMWIIAILSQLLPSEVVQAIFFFLINISGALGIYLLVKSELPYSKKAPLIAALFYIFNITSMTIIWNRFQYTFMVFYGGLPMALFLFSKALKQRSVIYSFLTVLMILAMGFAFASLPLIELIILVFCLYTSYFIFASKEKKEALKSSVLVAVIISVVALVINSWWLIQFYEVMKSSVYVTSVAYTPEGNLSTFLTLSESLGDLSYVFRMMHKDFFFNMREVWSYSYTNPFIITLTFIIPLLIFSPLIKKEKPAIIKYLTLYSLLVLYLMKGAHEPFGYFFTYFFNKLRFLEAFRNPFEKFSLLLPLGYAPLMGYSLDGILSKIQNRHKQHIAFISTLVLVCGVTVFPFWNRWVFTSNMKPSNNKAVGIYVEVPAEYKQANNYLNKDTSLFRSMLIPYQGEGILQNWKYGYSGVELSLELFDKPMLSLSTGVQFLPEIANPLQDLLIYKPSHFNKLMQLTNSKYVLIRSDIEKASQKYSPTQLESKLIESGYINKVQQFGQLSIYKLKDSEFSDKAYAATNVITVAPTQQNATELLPYSQYNKNSVILSREDVPKALSDSSVKESFYTANEKTSNEKVSGSVKYIPIVKPEVNPENALIELPFVNILPNDSRYFLVSIKELFESSGKKGTDADFVHLRQTGKRLVELNMLLNNNASEKTVRSTVKRYYEQLKKIKYEYIYNFVGVRKELVRHVIVLDNLQRKYKETENYPEIAESLSYLNNIFTNGIPTADNNNISYLKRDYEFDIPQTKEYQFSINEYSQNEATASYSTTLLINNKQQDLQVNSEHTIQFTQGINSIRFPVDDQQAIKQKQLNKRTILIKEYNPIAESLKIPELTTKQLNPSEYRVQVKGAKSPFILTFAESYHPLWTASINGKDIPPSNHFLANIYANGWYVQELGDYDINLYFKPQRTMEKYWNISKWAVMLVVVTTLILSGISFKNNHRRKKDTNVQI